MTNIPEHLYINTSDALSAFCTQLRERDYIVIDTEFLRERTYRPELCLVQIKHKEHLACIDTLAMTDVSALVDLLMDTSVVKVFHAASQDLEIFYMLCKSVPGPIFDTQIAAPLLGHHEQIGYANLVQERLGTELAKSQTRSDWTRRPLPEEQISYALDDVIYLEQLYLDMHRELSEQGRINWLSPAFAECEQPERYEQPAGERWLKVRQVQRHKGSTLSIIQHLARWREIKARETNQPRNWIFKDDVLVSLAQQKPQHTDDLQYTRGLANKARDLYANEIIACVQQGLEQPPEPLPAFVKKQKLNALNLAKLQLLSAWVHQRAAELNIAPGLLAPPKLLEKMVTGEGRRALRGWRDPLIGAELAALLDGKASLYSDNKGVVLTQR